MKECYKKALEVINKYKEEIKEISEIVLEKGTVKGEELEEIIKNTLERDK